ncbi:hypothetical protein SedNR2807_45330 [Citrobacter sedlakii]|uniref:Putative membrane protein n=1 Tax=Salmonella enterica I TaxID=59201 RepID=F2Q955_SALET|nr:hypothetical protein [Salmonella enterica]CAX68151.1 putative membrane protein [Salmonella enterica subsp. enterica] [Salmonella enterica subsp. enterica serovar Senftenberg]MDQ7447759.1 hypothetical protein [Salmonella enterica subsp. enterica serovar Agona]MDQ7465914.1 hypothetical protein [Salmonella enterica subsp. enterica serovar Agona]MDQ7484368.1 hypothetical protein [Salmonella enterica subsp. enterica serovar Agona]MDQ7686611.1 hypothetical protein [Salmonella enterica subsp. ente
MNQQRLNFSVLRGRAGRVLLTILYVLLFTALMLAFAAAMFEYDPDGRQLRGWLRESRPWLFVWRMVLYGSVALFWYRKVRPKLLKRWPEVTGRLPRTELIVGLYFVGCELLFAWSAMREGGL